MRSLASSNELLKVFAALQRNKKAFHSLEKLTVGAIVRCPMAGERPYLPVNQRSWLLEIGNRLRAEYAAAEEPVPDRLAKLIAQLETPPATSDRPAPSDNARPVPPTPVRECRAA
jgi:anti-sigma factor NepR-like protein